MDDELNHRRRGHRRKCLRAEPAGTVLARPTGLIPKIGLLAMLTAPLGGVQGSVATLAESDTASPRRPGSDRSTLSQVTPPTGEPDAGNPPVRFGGRGNLNQFSLPLYILQQALANAKSAQVFTGDHS